jgi:hypothetical protein
LAVITDRGGEAVTHTYHEGLPGFDQRQILHRGCDECEERGKDVRSALAHMDPPTFHRAWRRAFDLMASKGDHGAVGPVSEAEYPLLTVLWGVQVHLERNGVPLNGEVPSA